MQKPFEFVLDMVVGIRDEKTNIPKYIADRSWRSYSLQRVPRTVAIVNTIVAPLD